MKNQFNKESVISYLIISFFAIVFFITIYGVEVLDFQNVDWLYGRYEVKENCFYGNDLTQHYLGWVCYRNSDWTFPIGNMDRFSYPYSTSVIYTDSIPLFALVFKILSPIIPVDFQYFGLWALLCFVLQGVMAIRLFRSYTKNPIKLILGAAFFVVAPMLLWRTFIHSALCAHWIILMSMEPLVDKVIWNKKRLIIHYSLVGFFASMTAIYLLLFCGIVLIGTSVRYILETKRAVNSVLSLISFIGVAAVAIAIMGGFSGAFKSNLNGLGRYSMNLNSLLDSYGFSVFFKGLPQIEQNGGGQFEGYGYLGAGFILLSVFLLLYIFFKHKQFENNLRDNRYIALGMIVTFIVALIFALSPVISFNNSVLFTINIPQFIYNLWSIFRATGRGVWIVVYCIMFIGVRIVITVDSKRFSYIALGVCVCVQLFDGLHMYKKIYSYFHAPISASYKYENMTESIDFWEEVASRTNIDKIILANTFYPYDDETTYYIDGVYCSDIGPEPEFLMACQYLLGDFSIRNSKTFNYFRFSRHPYDRSREYVLERLKNPSEDELYFFTDYNIMQGIAAGLNMYRIDGLYIGSVSKLQDKYEIRNEEKIKRYSFDFNTDMKTNQKESYILPSSEGVNCFMMELPRGIYRFSIDASKVDDLNFSLAGDAVGNASLVWSNIDSEYRVSYYIFIEEDLYTTCAVIFNEGEGSVELKTMEIEYIGSEELLSE